MASKKGSLNSQSMVNLLRSYAENSSIHGECCKTLKSWNPRNPNPRNPVPAEEFPLHKGDMVNLGDLGPDVGGNLCQQHLHRLEGREDDHELEDDFKAGDEVGLSLGDDLQGWPEHAGGQGGLGEGYSSVGSKKDKT